MQSGEAQSVEEVAKVHNITSNKKKNLFNALLNLILVGLK
jgi:hypothetical protein